MGNYRFRFSDMIPNAWFYKLKYITKTRNPNRKNHPKTTAVPPPPPPHSNQNQPHHRRSYHLTRDDKFSQNLTTISTLQSPDPPRKSSKKRRSIRRTTTVRQSPKLVTTSVSATCSCGTTLNSVWTKPDSTPEEYPNSPLDSSSEKETLLPELNSEKPVFSSSTCPCEYDKEAMNDVHNKWVPSKFQNLNGFDLISEMVLPPIITKPKEPEGFTKIVEKNQQETLISKEQRRKYVRGFSVNSPAGVKLRTISPRIRNGKIQGNGRKSLSRRSISESVAVVKRSENPQRDFKESMVEMIMENNIRTSKDLEDLLACYLSLNSDEHHDVIIKVFKQIWFDVTDVRLK